MGFFWQYLFPISLFVAPAMDLVAVLFNKWTMVVVSAVVSLLIAFYLFGSPDPRFYLQGIALVILPFGSAVAIHRRNLLVAWLLTVPHLVIGVAWGLITFVNAGWL
jgi:hypothetical protein